MIYDMKTIISELNNKDLNGKLSALSNMLDEQLESVSKHYGNNSENDLFVTEENNVNDEIMLDEIPKKNVIKRRKTETTDKGKKPENDEERNAEMDEKRKTTNQENTDKKKVKTKSQLENRMEEVSENLSKEFMKEFNEALPIERLVYSEEFIEKKLVTKKPKIIKHLLKKLGFKENPETIYDRTTYKEYMNRELPNLSVAFLSKIEKYATSFFEILGYFLKNGCNKTALELMLKNLLYFNQKSTKMPNPKTPNKKLQAIQIYFSDTTTDGFMFYLNKYFDETIKNYAFKKDLEKIFKINGKGPFIFPEKNKMDIGGRHSRERNDSEDNSGRCLRDTSDSDNDISDMSSSEDEESNKEEQDSEDDWEGMQ
jgi:hypothetical protein